MIAILGATGNVGGKIADLLIKKGEEVRLIARSPDRLRTFAEKNVTILAGDANETEFLVKAFKDVDAVFTMIPPNPKAKNFLGYANAIGGSIARAIEIAKVKHVVNLSSIGAELAEGTGPIKALHAMEMRLKGIKGLNVLHLRPGYFMENVLGNVDLIRSSGINGSAVRGDIKIAMIASRDIASFAADRLVKRDFIGSSVRYLLGERDLSLTEATGIIGRKIDKPALSYVMFPYDEAEKAMVGFGLSPDMSRTYVEMSKAFNEGLIRFGNRTKENTTATPFESFCDEVFVPVYTQKKAA
jgi:uncharacterized protein YbjT (DUF2867 family)